MHSLKIWSGIVFLQIQISSFPKKGWDIVVYWKSVFAVIELIELGMREQSNGPHWDLNLRPLTLWADALRATGQSNKHNIWCLIELEIKSTHCFTLPQLLLRSIKVEVDIEAFHKLCNGVSVGVRLLQPTIQALLQHEVKRNFIFS